MNITWVNNHSEFKICYPNFLFGDLVPRAPLLFDIKVVYIHKSESGGDLTQDLAVRYLKISVNPSSIVYRVPYRGQVYLAGNLNLKS